MKTTFKIEGLRGVDAALGELIEATNGRTGKAALKRGLALAAEPMAERMRQLAPKKSGRLKRAIVVTTKVGNAAGKAAFAAALRGGADKATAVQALRGATRANPGSTVEVEIGIAKDKGGKGSLARHAHLVEFGTVPHTITAKKGGKDGRGLAVPDGSGGVARPKVVRHPGARAHPYMRPGFEQGAPLAVEAIKVTVTAEIDKAASRARAKAAKLSGKL